MAILCRSIQHQLGIHSLLCSLPWRGVRRGAEKEGEGQRQSRVDSMSLLVWPNLSVFIKLLLSRASALRVLGSERRADVEEPRCSPRRGTDFQKSRADALPESTDHLSLRSRHSYFPPCTLPQPRTPIYLRFDYSNPLDNNVPNVRYRLPQVPRVAVERQDQGTRGCCYQICQTDADTAPTDDPHGSARRRSVPVSEFSYSSLTPGMPGLFS